MSEQNIELTEQKLRPLFGSLDRLQKDAAGKDPAKDPCHRCEIVRLRSFVQQHQLLVQTLDFRVADARIPPELYRQAFAGEIAQFQNLLLCELKQQAALQNPYLDLLLQALALVQRLGAAARVCRFDRAFVQLYDNLGCVPVPVCSAERDEQALAQEKSRLAETSREIQGQLSEEADKLNVSDPERVSQLKAAIRVESEFQELQQQARSLGQLQQMRDSANMKRNQLVRRALVYQIED